MDKPVVSVMIPVYDADDSLLERALSSVFNQTLADWELVVVDDGSKNGCVERIPAKYLTDKRVRIVRQENQGLIGALNTGISESQGEYFYIIAQDDYMHLQTLEYCVKTLEQEGADLCVFSGYRQTKPDVPAYCDLGEFGNIPRQVLSVGDMHGANAARYGECFRRLNGDAWGHFARTSLVKEVHKIWPIYESNARLHLMMRMARKWVDSTASLYYYNASNPASLSKRPINAQLVKRASLDFEALCEIYKNERNDQTSLPMWEGVDKWCILRGAKILVNTFRRCNGKSDTPANRECLAAIAQMLMVIKARGALPIRKINLRLYLIYRWIMFRYGKPEYQRITEGLLSGHFFDGLEYRNDHVI
jgi:glycosyltransferase involved in cell wall biosynthesis